MKIKCKESFLEGCGYVIDLLDQHAYDILVTQVIGTDILAEEYIEECIAALCVALNTMHKETSLEFENE